MVWVDVEDLFDYFRYNPHPSGIQRVVVEIMRALLAVAGESRLRFARRDAGAIPGALREIPWPAIEAMLQTPPTPEAVEPPEPADEVELRSRVQRAVLRLPPELRDPLLRAGVLQSQVGRNVRALAHLVRPPPPRALRELPPGEDLPQSAGPRAGDLFLVLGAPWSVPGGPALLAALRGRGVRTALLVHDLIPLRRPEWSPPARVARFRRWLEGSLPHCDALLTLSAHTEGELAGYAARVGMPIPPPRVLPAGTVTLASAASRPAGLPIPGSYVLFVSTLEARKNHAVAVKVWHKLMAEIRAGTRDPASVPQLVFAGRVGIGVADLLQQLDNSRWLGGRIRLIREAGDAEIRALYEGCRFSLLPSLAEGWGLPLGESLALGKPCLAASGTALPEAGGDLCRYFDPEDAGDAHRAVAALLDAPGVVAEWEADVRRRFRPRDWHGAARAILAAAGAPA